MLEHKNDKWYFRNSSLIIALLCIGPLALPLVWFNPRFNKTIKVIISIIVIALTYYLTIFLLKSLQYLNQYYQQML